MVAELPSVRLDGGTFLLRPFCGTDFTWAHSAREHPATAQWVNALPATTADDMTALTEDLRRRGRLLHLAMIGSEDNSYYGEVLLFIRTPEAGETAIGEIAYVVAPAVRGRGIAAIAVRLLSEWAFRQLGLKRLQLSIRPDNAASRRVAEKAGYTFEGVLRSTKLIRGTRVDAALYSRLPSDL
ncbi:MAG: GNAT family N-acetyltransferase [Mycobacteriaceae bacterium]